MTSPVQITAIIVSALLLLLVVELVRRRKLTEEYSFLWIICAVALLVLSIRREILHAVARWLGVFYPPAVLLMVLILFVFVACLYFSVVISRHRRQIERLVEEMALLAAHQQEVDGLPGTDRQTVRRASMVTQVPRVSLCVPVCNGAAYLCEALDSALAQTFDQFELLVVDDASTDGSAAIAERYARRDARVRVHVNHRNLGLPGNWSRCAELARADWIKFLFQDDRLEPSCLERMLRMTRSGVELVACRRTRAIDPELPETVRREYDTYAAQVDIERHFPARDLITADQVAEYLIDHPIDNFIGEPSATLISRAAFARSGGFHPYLVQLVDWECWARLGLQGDLAYVDEALVTCRFHARSSTATNMVTRRYRKDVIDPLVILHEMAYGPAYEAVRLAASRRDHPVDLVARLAAAAARARQLASQDPGDPFWGTHALGDWEDAARRYPRLCLT